MYDQVDKSIVDRVLKLNETFFKASPEDLMKPQGSGFMKEETLSLKVTPNDEEVVLIWLVRIQRYFLVKYSDQTQDSKSNTAVLIKGFLSKINELPAPIKRYLSSDPLALNCLIFSVLLSQDEKDWETVKLLITEHAPKLYPALALCHDFYFGLTNTSNLSENSNAAVLNTEVGNLPLKYFFGYLKAYQKFQSNPKNLEIFKDFYEQGLRAELFTNNLMMVQHLNFAVTKLFLSELKVTATVRQEYFKKFLNYFLRECFYNLNEFQDKKQLSSISYYSGRKI